MESGARRILVLAVLVALAGVGVFWYWQRARQRALSSGNVYVKSQGPEVQSVQTETSPALPSAATPPESAASPEAAGYSKPSAGVQHIPSPSQPAHAAPIPMTQPRGAVAVPAADSIPRNPPNGLIFAGAGKYQLYRQGDITWRLDTDDGRACIIFATDTMWSKTRVWDAGCGAS